MTNFEDLGSDTKSNEKMLERYKQKIMESMGVPAEMLLNHADHAQNADNGSIVKQTTPGGGLYAGADFGLSGGDQSILSRNIIHADNMFPVYSPTDLSEVAATAELKKIFEEVPDHMDKYNKDTSEADEKLKNISNLNADVQKPAGHLGKLGEKDIIKKGNLVIHKRNNSSYRKLWAYFLDSEGDEYFKTMGYTKEDIIRIGYKKFIDAHDWMTIEDIKKWKTDAVHIIPCVHCGDEFVTYELDMGLCDECKKFYDMERFALTCQLNELQEPGISFAIITGFVYDNLFRETFLHTNIKDDGGVKYLYKNDRGDIRPDDFDGDTMGLVPLHKK
ncbi:MAG: hypothetical protein K0R00_154 [Herbinix sp.]|jgi:hypothetical protein|nr:hypothetical protein [Herbinix sp.]